jgi:hypothetical protein
VSGRSRTETPDAPEQSFTGENILQQVNPSMRGACSTGLWNTDSLEADFRDDEMTDQDPDMVGDINNHTSGTEFYGTSSNFVLLNQLFSHAQLRLPREGVGPMFQDGTPHLSPSGGIRNSQNQLLSGSGPSPESAIQGSIAGSSPQLQIGPGRISIVNLLYNEENLSPPSRPKTPVTTTNKVLGSSGSSSNTAKYSNQGTHDPGRRRRRDSARLPRATRHEDLPDNPSTASHTHPPNADRSNKDSSARDVQGAETRLEKEYVRIYFHNIHHIHPILNPAQFTARCEEEVWNSSSSARPSADRMHFFALYNIVVAVGALIAGLDVAQQFERDLKICARLLLSRDPSQIISSQKLSKIYFWKARSLLGDVFEVCSIESAQTHLLMVSHGSQAQRLLPGTDYS